VKVAVVILALLEVVQVLALAEGLATKAVSLHPPVH
jgi:hypothetical protein